MFTISGISKFGKIVETLLGVIRTERFYEVLEGIVNTCSHSLGLVRADLEHREEKYSCLKKKNKNNTKYIQE